MLFIQYSEKTNYQIIKDGPSNSILFKGKEITVGQAKILSSDLMVKSEALGKAGESSSQGRAMSLASSLYIAAKMVEGKGKFKELEG